MKRLFFILYTTTLLFAACSQRSKNKLSILFDNVENLEKGALVKLHGITIGKVASLSLFGDSVLVDIILEKEQKIPVGSKFSIINSLIGGSSIIIEGSEQKIFLTTTDTVRGSYETKGLLDIFFADSLNRNKAKEALNKITTGLKELSEAKNDSAVK